MFMANTNKHKRFIAEYLIDQNGKQAAIRAGYSPKSAEVQASVLLRNPKIKAAIDKKIKKIADRSGISAEWVLKNLKEVAERCMQKVPVMRFDKVDKEYVQVEDENGQGVWQFDSSGANKALELIGKNLGMFAEKHVHSGSITLEQLLCGGEGTE